MRAFAHRLLTVPARKLWALCLLAPLACLYSPLSPSDPLPLNIRVLEAGRAYRSAQPTPAVLESMVEVYGIRTVINLRGPNAGKIWYDLEKSACDQLGITLLDFPMSAGSLPRPELLADILNALKTAEYPILIHCQGGADRSGAISAIYRMLIVGEEKSAALAHLSPLFAHFRQFTPCMDTLAELYEPTDEWFETYRATWDQIPCTP